MTKDNYLIWFPKQEEAASFSNVQPWFMSDIPKTAENDRIELYNTNSKLCDNFMAQNELISVLEGLRVVSEFE